MTKLLSLSILGVVRFGWIPLAYMYTPVPASIFVLMSASTTVDTISVTLTSIIVTQPLSFYPLPAMSVASKLASIFWPPVLVRTLTSAAALVLSSVLAHLVDCPVFLKE